MLDNVLILDFASQRCSLSKSASTLTINVSPVRASILCHLHRDSFECHFTPCIDCVWMAPPSASPPGYQTSSSGSVPPAGCGLRMEIGQCCSHLPTPHPPCIITFLLHHPLKSEPSPEVWACNERMGWSICSWSLSFHPQDLPPNQSLLIYPLWSQSVSIFSINTHKRTHIHYRQTASLCLSRTPPFSPVF